MKQKMAKIERKFTTYVSLFVLPIEVLLLSIIPNEVLGGITLITAGLVLISAVDLVLRVVRLVDEDASEAARLVQHSEKIWED